MNDHGQANLPVVASTPADDHDHAGCFGPMLTLPSLSTFEVGCDAHANADVDDLDQEHEPDLEAHMSMVGTS